MISAVAPWQGVCFSFYMSLMRGKVLVEDITMQFEKNQKKFVGSDQFSHFINWMFGCTPTSFWWWRLGEGEAMWQLPRIRNFGRQTNCVSVQPAKLMLKVLSTSIRPELPIDNRFSTSSIYGLINRSSLSIGVTHPKQSSTIATSISSATLISQLTFEVVKRHG